MPSQALTLVPWHALTPEFQQAVRRISLPQQQIEYAGTIDRAIAACESADPQELAGLAILLNAQAVGFVVLSRGTRTPDWAPDGAIALTAMRIDASMQGQGLGRLALAAVDRWVMQHWPENASIALCVDDENAAGRRAYAQAGYSEYTAPRPGRIGLVRCLSKALATSSAAGPSLTEPLAVIQARLQAQGAARSHLQRIAQIRQLAEQSPHCLGIALVGSFAQNKGDRISDLDLAAIVADNREAEFLKQADALLRTQELMHDYGRIRHGELAFRKYVFLDFSSCEFHAFNQHAPFRLRRPYIPVWDPTGHLRSLVIDEPPPRHETFEPYPHGDDGLVWELLDCIKWLSRGRTELARSYLSRLGDALGPHPTGRP